MELPRDDNRIAMQLNPKGEALAVTVDASISSATDISLNANTKFIEVTALTKSVFLKYGATASAADFDEFIPLDTSKGFYVPDGVSTISVIEESASAKVIVIEK